MQRRLRIALIATAATGALALGAGTAFAASPADSVSDTVGQATDGVSSSAPQLKDATPNPDQLTDQLHQGANLSGNDLPKAPDLGDAAHSVPSVGDAVHAPDLPEVGK